MRLGKSRVVSLGKETGRIVALERAIRIWAGAFNLCALSLVLILLSLMRKGILNDRMELGLGVALLVLLLINTIFFFFMGRLRQDWADLESQFERDDLTGVLNRMSFDKMVNEELRRSGRYHYPLSICFLDIDDFRSYNENFGEEKGNILLTDFARLLNASLRFSDCIARYDQDQFGILLPHTDILGAQKLLTRIQLTLEERLDISFCAGITSSQGSEGRSDFVERADLALRQARREGKKRIRSVLGGGDSKNSISL